MKSISVAEFNERLLNFREVAFSANVTNEERKDAFKHLTRSYFNVDLSDPKFNDSVAMIFDSTVIEFTRRMGLMGIPLTEVSC